MRKTALPRAGDPYHHAAARGRAGSRLAVAGRRLAVAAVAAGGLALAACGDAPDGAASGAAEMAVLNPWVRTAIAPDAEYGPDAPPVNSAAYLVLVNGTDAADALVAVETAVADTAEIHSVTMDDGVMRMRPVDSVAVPAGGRVALEPGGYHIMLIGIREGLSQGESVALRLRLRSGRVLDVSAPIHRSPPQTD